MLETTAEVTGTTRLPTRFGTFRFESFRCEAGGEPHLALSMGLHENAVPVVRVHSECISGDVFGSVKCDCGDQLRDAMRRIGEVRCGVILYLRQEGRGIGIEQKIRAYALQEGGLDTVDANLALGLPVDNRSYAPAVAYLRERGVRRCVLLTNNPEKTAALREQGLQVVREPLQSGGHEACRSYLATKRVRMGHDC
jgi:GTP cyclohydrolase II